MKNKTQYELTSWAKSTVCLCLLVFSNNTCVGSETYIQNNRICKPWLMSTISKTCLRAYTEKKTKEEAEVFCSHHDNGKLVKILDPKENEAVTELIQINEKYWIGLSRPVGAFKYKWNDEIKEAEYLNFAQGEPKGHKQCVTIRKQDTSQWFSEDCDAGHYFVCEHFGLCYGHEDHCEKPCSQFCFGQNTGTTCNTRNGECFLGCLPGYDGKKCEDVCFSQNKYGEHCSQECSMHCGGAGKACHHIDGTCLAGCVAGATGDLCNMTCEMGSYGTNCSMTCPLNCLTSCDAFNGKCVNGCIAGYKGDFCNTECDDGEYGETCKMKCSPHCAEPSKLCNRVNGTCLDGCEKGWTGPHCMDYARPFVDALKALSRYGVTAVLVVAGIVGLTSLVLGYIKGGKAFPVVKEFPRKQMAPHKLDYRSHSAKMSFSTEV